jgi:hypothetical protein
MLSVYSVYIVQFTVYSVKAGDEDSQRLVEVRREMERSLYNNLLICMEVVKARDENSQRLLEVRREMEKVLIGIINNAHLQYLLVVKAPSAPSISIQLQS